MNWNGIKYNQVESSIKELLSSAKARINQLTLDAQMKRSYLAFEGVEEEGGVELKLVAPDSEHVLTIEWSRDMKHWQSVTSSEEGTTIAFIYYEDIVYVRGTGPTGWYDEEGEEATGHKFSADGKLYVYGNIMSLLSDDFTKLKEVPVGAFARLFAYGDWLFSHPQKKLFIPATQLSDYCYTGMFRGCTSLTEAPELPAMTLAECCYETMFYGCSSLINTFELPAKTLTQGCYANMFTECSSLITTPKILATSVASNCCYSMFSNCTSLITTTELLATTTAKRCYALMFRGCSSLKSAPNLPATVLAERCYANMFQECTSLKQAPKLLAETLAPYCYDAMFEDCNSLDCIIAMFTTIPGSTYTNNWLRNVSQTGTFVKSAEASWNTIGASGVPEGWNTLNTTEQFLRPFTIEASEDNTIVYFRQSSYGVYDKQPVLTVKISTDEGKHWVEKTASRENGKGTIIATINKGERVIIIGENSTYAHITTWEGDNEYCNNCNFLADKCCYVYGNIMSLVKENNFETIFSVNEGAFSNFFSSYGMLDDYPSWVLLNKNKELVLPAITLTDTCYSSMFEGQTKITFTPKLPATVLARDCYSGMFRKCTGLVTAESLPATTLAHACYYYMFAECTGLIQGPELLALALETFCYSGMFSNCINLTFIKALFLTIPNSTCLLNWTQEVSSTGTFVKNSEATWDVTGKNGIPTGWTVETASE